MKYDKTIIFLNLRFSDFYSKDLLRRVKEREMVRFVAVIDQQFKDKIGAHIEPYLDQIIYLPSKSKNGFLAEFFYDDLFHLIKSEMRHAKNVNIVCSDEFNLLNAGRLRRELNIKGHTDENLVLYRDKTKMKERLEKEGIRVPKFQTLNQSDTFEQLVYKVNLPFVIKPVDSCGSHGVSIVKDTAQFDELKESVGFRGFEVEEYIEGKLYHVDSCIRNNDITFICASEYTYPNHDYTKGKALGSIPLDKEDHLSIRLIDFAKNCLAVLKTNNMVNHMELFHTKDNEIIFLEVSGRPPGALVNLTHQLNFGFNLMDEDFYMQANINMQTPASHNNENVFFALFPLLPGKVIKLNSPQVKSRVDIKWHVAIGDVIDVKDCTNIVGKSAHAVFYNTDKKVLRDDFEIIKQHKAIEVN